jgi:TonB family protein
MKKLVFLLSLFPALICAQTVSADTTLKNLVIEEKPSKGAEFNGGMGELYKFLGQKIKYPKIARDNNYQGKILILFVVDTLGNVHSPVVVNKGEFHPSLEEEALRIVKLFPNFIPAENNGKKVNSYFTIPVNFNILGKTTSEPSIKDNVLEYLDNIRDYDTKPKLNQEVPLDKLLKEELKGLSTSIIVGFDIHKTGATKSIYIIDSYRELTKEEKNKIIAAFKKIQWTPAVNLSRNVNVRCTYSIKID